MPDVFDRTAYPSIPTQLWIHHDRLCVDHPQHRLVETIHKQGAEKTWRGIDDMFRLACQATGLPPGQLFESLGFGCNDFDSANFQAMMGILRAMNILGQHGFTDFQPLRPLPNRKEVDFLAKRNHTLHAVEVFRSSENAYRYAEPDNPTSAFPAYLQRRLQEKLPQVSATMQAHNCAAGMVVVVMDSYPSKALNDADEYQESVKVAFEQVGNPQGMHLFLFTGMADMHGGDEYACYPPLSELPPVPQPSDLRTVKG